MNRAEWEAKFRSELAKQQIAEPHIDLVIVVVDMLVEANEDGYTEGYGDGQAEVEED